MYGPAPAPNGDWLKLRAPVFWAYVRMMPRIEAQQALAVISQMAAGSGAMKEQDQRSYLAELRRAANGQRRTQKASLEQIAAMGIRVVRKPLADAA